MDKDTLWGVKQIVEEFGDQLTGNKEDLEYDSCTAEENKKEVNRLHNELDELYAKAEAFDRIVEHRRMSGVKILGHYANEVIRDYESGYSE